MKVIPVSKTQPNTYASKQSKNVSTFPTLSFGGKAKYEPVMSDISNEEMLRRLKEFKEKLLRGEVEFGPGEDPFKAPGYNPDASD